MEQELSGYEFLAVGGANNIYVFKSRFGAGYEVKFKPSGYVLDTPEFAEFVFELVIVLVDNPYEPKLPPADALMSTTIRAIVSDFFCTRERVVLYICDDSDSKADSRRKLFDRWYMRYKKEMFIKFDLLLGMDENGSSYSAELVSRVDNPYFTPIYESFKRAVFGIK